MTESVLVRALRRSVSEALARLDAEAEATGRGRLSRDTQRVRGRELLWEEVDGLRRARLAEGRAPLTEAEEDDLVRAAYDALFGLGALEVHLADESVENVFANGCDQVWLVRADGTKERAAPLADSDEELVELLRSAAARLGRSERRFDAGSPALNLRLPDGSRLFAAMGVCARPSVSVRRHRHAKVTLGDLVGLGTLDESLCSFLAAAVAARRNVVVCGGTDVGKTTFLRALLAEVPPAERLVVIEDEAELNLGADPEAHPDVVEYEKREANLEGEGLIALADLVRWALRMAPDRVVVGEVRGAEVLPMLLAMSQGNDGSMCTLHADSSAGAFARLAMYAVMAPERLPLEATNLLVANSVHFVVHLAKLPGGTRAVTSVREVVAADGQLVVTNEVFAPGPDGRARPGAPLRDVTAERLVAAGLDHGLLAAAGGWA